MFWGGSFSYQHISENRLANLSKNIFWTKNENRKTWKTEDNDRKKAEKMLLHHSEIKQKQEQKITEQKKLRKWEKNDDERYLERGCWKIVFRLEKLSQNISTINQSSFFFILSDTVYCNILKLHTINNKNLKFILSLHFTLFLFFEKLYFRYFNAFFNEIRNVIDLKCL